MVQDSVLGTDACVKSRGVGVGRNIAFAGVRGIAAVQNMYMKLYHIIGYRVSFWIQLWKKGFKTPAQC